MSGGIRLATRADIDWLIAQLRQFSEFFGSQKPLLDESDNCAHARSVMENFIDNHVLFMADDSAGAPVGFIAGWAVLHPFNPKIRVLTEALWWVDQTRRGGRAALKLLDAFVEWGKRNVDWIQFTLELASPVRHQTLERRGFRMRESSFLLEVG